MSSRGERRRASGLLDCIVMRSVKTAHELFDIDWDLAPPHNYRPEIKGRCGDERIGESNRSEVVMKVRPASAMERVA